MRSGTSIGANVEEGQGSQIRADFVAKYSIVCKEAREPTTLASHPSPLLLSCMLLTDFNL